VATYAALVVAGSAGRITWVSGRESVTGAPVRSLLQPLWPDYRVLSAPGGHPGELALHLGWSTAALAVLLLTARRVRAGSRAPSHPPPPLRHSPSSDSTSPVSSTPEEPR
jgi:hypothetical protein